MIPGEILTKTDDVVLNADKDPIRSVSYTHLRAHETP